MVGQLYVDSGGTTQLSRHDSALRWGAALGGRYNLGRIEIGGQGGLGEGIGRKYFDQSITGFLDAVLVVGANTAELKPALVYSALGYAQIKLTDTIRATGIFSWGMNELASELPGYYMPGTTSRGTLSGVTNWYMSAHGNILWNSLPQVTLGAEYSYPSKYNAANVTVQRLQFAAIYRF